MYTYIDTHMSVYVYVYPTKEYFILDVPIF